MDTSPSDISSPDDDSALTPMSNPADVRIEANNALFARRALALALAGLLDLRHATTDTEPLSFTHSGKASNESDEEQEDGTPQWAAFAGNKQEESDTSEIDELSSGSAWHTALSGYAYI